MSIIDRIHAQSSRGAVHERQAAEKQGEAEIGQLKDKREALRQTIDRCHDRAVSIGDELAEAQDQGFLADVGDWLSGDDPEAEALEDASANQAQLDRAQQQQAVLAEQQKAELDRIAEANQRMQATQQLVRTIDQARRTRAI